MSIHISPDDEDFLSACSESEWEAYCNKHDLDETTQETLLAQIGRKDLKTVSPT